MLPAPLCFVRSPDRQKTRLRELEGRQRLRVLGRGDLHGGWRRWVWSAASLGRWSGPWPRALPHRLLFPRTPSCGAARSGLHEHRHPRQLGGLLADELVSGGERGRRARGGGGDRWSERKEERRAPAGKAQGASHRTRRCLTAQGHSGGPTRRAGEPLPSIPVRPGPASGRKCGGRGCPSGSDSGREGLVGSLSSEWSPAAGREDGGGS